MEVKVPIEIHNPYAASYTIRAFYPIIYGGDRKRFYHARCRLLGVLLAVLYVIGCRWRFADSAPLTWRVIDLDMLLMLRESTWELHKERSVQARIGTPRQSSDRHAQE